MAGSILTKHLIMTWTNFFITNSAIQKNLSYSQDVNMESTNKSKMSKHFGNKVLALEQTQHNWFEQCMWIIGNIDCDTLYKTMVHLMAPESYYYTNHQTKKNHKSCGTMKHTNHNIQPYGHPKLLHYKLNKVPNRTGIRLHVPG